MTGRDIIIYILKNGLEDEPIFKDGKLIGFLSIPEVAVKCNVGVATVNVWIKTGQIDSIAIGDLVLVPGDFISPIDSNKTN
jgi:hypothetical protein